MNLSSQIAKHFREVYYGGNWTDSNLKSQLESVTWQQAVTQLPVTKNTIAVLVFHIDYYVRAAIMVLEGKSLNAHDKFSFDAPAIQSDSDWKKFLQDVWANAEKFSGLVEKLPDSKLDDIFFAEKYGNYYRNLHGVVEHTHYHLGQLVLVKKLVTASTA